MLDSQKRSPPQGAPRPTWSGSFLFKAALSPSRASSRTSPYLLIPKKTGREANRIESQNHIHPKPRINQFTNGNRPKHKLKLAQGHTSSTFRIKPSCIHFSPKCGVDSQRCARNIRHLFRPPPTPCAPPGLCPASGLKRHGAEGGVSRPSARASCKPHPGSPGGTDPPRPSLGSPQAQAFVSHALTSSHTHSYLRRHARTHSDCLAHTRKGRTHWPHACRGWGWRRPRKERTDGRAVHAQTA